MSSEMQSLGCQPDQFCTRQAPDLQAARAPLGFRSSKHGMPAIVNPSARLLQQHK